LTVKRVIEIAYERNNVKDKKKCWSLVDREGRRRTAWVPSSNKWWCSSMSNVLSSPGKVTAERSSCFSRFKG